MKGIIFCIVLTSCNLLLAQDLQWLILNGNAKTGFDELSKTNQYGAPLSNFIFNGNTFSIDNVKHPIQVMSKIPRNDFFVIYHDGSYFNSRYINKGSIYPFAPLNSISYAIKSNYFQTSPIDYFYLTNIYEEDDPPSSIKIGNNTTSPEVEIGTSNQNGLELNHDFVAGKDVTLVVPNNLINCPGGISKLSFDSSILTPNPVFGNNSRYSFNEIVGLNLVGNQIFGITTPLKNHFFNFKVNDSVPANKIGETAEFKLYCDTTQIASLKDTIRSGHDPNFIRLLCVYKKKVRKKDQFIGVYRVLFMNEGNGIVDSVKVRLKFPSHVKIKNADPYFYYYGGEKGYRQNIDSFVSRIDGNFIEFNFKKGFLKIFEEKSINFNRLAKGGIEFQVLIDKNPADFKVKLLPDASQISFDKVSHKFDFFYDLNEDNPRLKKRCRKIIKNVCDCPTAVKPKDCK